jgi:hypothetical protein
MAGPVPATHDLRVDGYAAAGPELFLNHLAFMGRRDEPGDDERGEAEN